MKKTKKKNKETENKNSVVFISSVNDIQKLKTNKLTIVLTDSLGKNIEDETKACAKIVVYNTNANKYFVLADQHNKLFNPISSKINEVGSLGKKATKEYNMLEVKEVIYKRYIEFLKEQNTLYLKQAQILLGY